MEMNERLNGYFNLIKGEKSEKFDFFYKLLLEYNEKFNLTTIIEPKDVLYKHFLDSSAGEFLFKPNSSVCEIGSGAGFPSIVLKILREDLSFTLVESVGKKCEFLQAAVDNLSLKSVTVLNKRAEDIAKDSKYREKFDYCTARAVARLNTLCEYCMPFVKVGGSFVSYKGEGGREEIKEALSAVKILGGRVEGEYYYELDENYGKRSLFEIKKIKNTLERYPRGNGKERKQPL